jgi:hypothetical protein
MKQTLSGPSRPRSIQVEANKGQKSELQRFMSEHGYKVDHAHFTRRGKQLKSQGVPEDQIAHNVVFVPA